MALCMILNSFVVLGAYFSQSCLFTQPEGDIQDTKSAIDHVSGEREIQEVPGGTIAGEKPDRRVKGRRGILCVGNYGLITNGVNVFIATNKLYVEYSQKYSP